MPTNRDERIGPGVTHALAVAALAVAGEFTFRAFAPLPYAPTLLALAESSIIYFVLALPAVAVGRFGGPVARGGGILLALPFAVMAANHGSAFGLDSPPILAGLMLVGFISGWFLVARFSTGRLAIVLAVPIVAALVWRAGEGRESSQAETPNVLLIVLDTTSAASLSAYGYERPTSPGLEKLAHTALVYDRAISPAPWTLPAHASIFSGRYPSELGFNGYGFPDDYDAGSLAGDLSARGWATAAISANPLVMIADQLRPGFGRGWSASHLTQSVVARMLERLTHRATTGFRTRGERVTDLALDWMDRLAPAGQPWFLFLNYIDPHNPYRPPAEQRRLLAPGIDPDILPLGTKMLNSGAVPFTQERKAALVALYDAEILAMDLAVERLLDELAERAYDSDNLLVIVTSDHGESLGEHGFVGHLLGMTDRVLRVPLMISGPGVTAGVIHAPVQTVQLRSTVASLLGYELDTGPAVALPPWGAAPSMLISEHPEPGWYLEESLSKRNPDVDVSSWHGDWVALESAGIKVVFNDEDSGSTYRLMDDPGELRPRDISEGRSLVHMYRRWLKRPPSMAQPVLTEETRRALEAMGYLH